jgi:hypothetical protein
MQDEHPIRRTLSQQRNGCGEQIGMAVSKSFSALGLNRVIERRQRLRGGFSEFCSGSKAQDRRLLYRRFAAMTWKERDAFMAKPENAVVRERYEKHLASVTA